MGEPTLLASLLSLVGLLVVCDQLPSSIEGRYLHFPPPSMNLWLCTGQDPLGGLTGTMYLVPLIRSEVVRVTFKLEESLAPVSSQGLSHVSGSDLWVFPVSSGDNVDLQQMGQGQFKGSADGLLWL